MAERDFYPPFADGSTASPASVVLPYGFALFDFTIQAWRIGDGETPGGIVGEGLTSAGGLLTSKALAGLTSPTDIRLAMQDLVNEAQGRTILVDGYYTMSGMVELPANTRLQGLVAGAGFLSTTPDQSIFRANEVDNCNVERLTLGYTTGSAEAYTGCVTFVNANGGSVERCICSGLPWAGVYIIGSSDIQVIRNWFDDTKCLADNSSAVGIYNASQDCLVQLNRSTADCWVSYFIQDTSNDAYPCYRNRIDKNFSRNARVYGIAVYLSRAVSAPVDTFNEVTGNDIADVTDDAYTHGGSGIYIVGHGAGGTKVLDNTVRNCCQQTVDRQNAPAGISITNIAAECTPVAVAGNMVRDMTQGDGISVTSSDGGATLGYNDVELPASNDGAGPGGGTLRGSALRIENSSNVTVQPGKYVNLGAGQAVLLNATSRDVENISISIGYAYCAESSVLQTSGEAGNLNKSVNIIGGIFETDGAGTVFTLSSLDVAVISGVQATGATGTCVNASGVTNVRFGGSSRFHSTGATGVAFGGTMTGSVLDRSCVVTRVISNGSTGGRIEQRLSALPGAGDFRIGDFIEITAVVAAGPTGYGRATNGSGATVGTDWLLAGSYP